VKFHDQGLIRSIKESIYKFYLIKEGYTPSPGNEISPRKENHPHDKARSSTPSADNKECNRLLLLMYTERDTLLFVFAVLMNAGRFLLIKVQEEELRVK
jgi:hypothetical protein